MARKIEFRLNHKAVSLEVDEYRSLLWVLRTELNLTGAKPGCGIGECGSCTVLVNGAAVRSCQLPMRDVSGKEVLTIEGLEQEGDLHPVQKAFIEHDALQCGYCTPGMILTAYALLAANPNPTEEEIIRVMDGNLCRCGAYPRIVRAIRSAAGEMSGGAK